MRAVSICISHVMLSVYPGLRILAPELLIGDERRKGEDDAVLITVSAREKAVGQDAHRTLVATDIVKSRDRIHHLSKQTRIRY